MRNCLFQKYLNFLLSIGAYNLRPFNFDDNFFVQGVSLNHEGSKKSSNPFETGKNGNGINQSEDEGSDSPGHKPQKLFIIKHKRLEKSIGRNTAGESDSVGSSPTRSKFLHVPVKFSSFKGDLRKITNLYEDKHTIEEKKSESNVDTTRTVTTEELAVSKNGESQRDSIMKSSGEYSNDALKASSVARVKSKRNSLVLRKDNQVNFNVKIGEILGEGNAHIADCLSSYR